MYEVSSIKNANPSIKYEWMKLQKFQIAHKKGINVVVRFLYLEIDLKTQPSTGNWVEQNKCTPYSIWRNIFQRPLLLHPLQKHVEDAEDVEGVPLGNF